MDKSCTICLQETDEPFCETACSHLFHSNCMLKWHYRTKEACVCPVCRSPIPECPDLHSIEERMKAFAMTIPRGSIRSCVLRLLYAEREDTLIRAVKKLEHCFFTNVAETDETQLETLKPFARQLNTLLQFVGSRRLSLKLCPATH